MTRTRGVACALIVLLSACTGDDGAAVESGRKPLTREEMLKPETCEECHPKHYREWSASMHAYATDDPVFIAMNKRGQREAKLGKFCVNCHAPMAVIEQPDTDWTKADPSELPDHLQGVTCYFCHNAIGTDGDHNNMIRLANDTTMRGGLRNPIDPKVHGVEYSELHDHFEAQSSFMCGGCHDIETPNRVHLERTFEEYRDSLFSKTDYDGFQTCNDCHMQGRPGVAATVKGLNVPGREGIHEHLWPGVDMPLTEWPHREALRSAIEECELPNSVNMYVDPASSDSIGLFTFQFETNAGHRQPSGAAHDRRMWFEVNVKDAAGKTTFDTGSVADDALEVAPEGNDPFWAFRDTIYDKNGEEAHMFWDAAPSTKYPDGYISTAMPELKVAIAGGHSTPPRDYPFGLAPARAEVRLRVRPMGMDVLQDLVASKDLDPSILEQMPTFTAYSETLEWPTPGANPEDFTRTKTTLPQCDRYRCLLDPNSTACDTD